MLLDLSEVHEQVHEKCKDDDSRDNSSNHINCFKVSINKLQDVEHGINVQEHPRDSQEREQAELFIEFLELGVLIQRPRHNSLLHESEDELHREKDARRQQHIEDVDEHQHIFDVLHFKREIIRLHLVFLPKNLRVELLRRDNLPVQHSDFIEKIRQKQGRNSPHQRQRVVNLKQDVHEQHVLQIGPENDVEDDAEDRDAEDEAEEDRAEERGPFVVGVGDFDHAGHRGGGEDAVLVEVLVVRAADCLVVEDRHCHLVGDFEEADCGRLVEVELQCPVFHVLVTDYPVELDCVGGLGDDFELEEFFVDVDIPPVGEVLVKSQENSSVVRDFKCSHLHVCIRDKGNVFNCYVEIVSCLLITC